MDLKPCPFCGGEARLYRKWVECKNCGATTWLDFETEEDAIEAWNRRASDVH